ncbi:MAG: DUF2219 family protein [Caulobacteraceae bacterium]|nr:DUF2219 family protein [Caulobacteraceae bacterium]
MRTLHGLLLAIAALLSATRAEGQTLVYVAKDVHAPLSDTSPLGWPAFSGSAVGPFGPWAAPPLVAGIGPAVWRTGEVSVAGKGGAVDTLRLSVGGLGWTSGGVASGRLAGLLMPGAQAFDFDYVRRWPSAVRLKAGAYDIDLSPHAGFGANNAGGSAEAGAMVRLGARLKDQVAARLDRLGVPEVDAAAFGDRGHWYLFAAASGRAVGLNMVSDQPGDFQHAGWSAEGTSALVGDAQAGLGWRKGEVQASFGYVHREIKSVAQTITRLDGASFSDSMVALSLTFRPR